MKKLIGLLALIFVASLPTMAQLETPRIEVGGGYTYRNYNVQFSPRVNLNGWFATADFNLNKYVGIAADFDGVYGSIQGTTVHQYTYMFGPRFYPMGHRKFTPFVHALFGGSTFIIPNSPPNDSAFAFAIGGGLDASVTHNIAIRVGEFDYEQTRNFGGGSPTLDNQNNFKVKVGVIFRF